MNITNMLKRLWPQAHHQYRRLPIFGEILEEFGQWSLQQGFRPMTVRYDMDSLRRLVPWFQRRNKHTVDDLSASDVAEARAHYRRRNWHWAGAIRKLGRFLQTLGRLRPGRVRPPTGVELALADFEEYLRRERGLAAATIEARHYHLRQFVRFLHFDRGASLKRLTLPQVERFLARCARRYCRRSMPIVVATVRSFLRFQHQRGVLPKALHEQVGTVRTYQHEQLPQPMPWAVIRQLLKQIDRSTPLGQRDYTILLLAATYGLRRSEVVALTLEDINWRARTLRISQSKTHQQMALPLTDEVGTALVDYLEKARPRSAYREVFLRHRPPVAPMPVWMAGRTLQYAARRAGVTLPTPHFHSLRHAVALRLLHHGAGLKSIGDLLGHRDPDTTAGYLRLDVEDLRSLALPVPRPASGNPVLASATHGPHRSALAELPQSALARLRSATAFAGKTVSVGRTSVAPLRLLSGAPLSARALFHRGAVCRLDGPVALADTDRRADAPKVCAPVLPLSGPPAAGNVCARFQHFPQTVAHEITVLALALASGPIARFHELPRSQLPRPASRTVHAPGPDPHVLLRSASQ